MSNQKVHPKLVESSTAYVVVELSSDDDTVDFDAETINDNSYQQEFNINNDDHNKFSTPIQVSYDKYQIGFCKNHESYLGEVNNVKKTLKQTDLHNSSWSSEENIFENLEKSDSLYSAVKTNLFPADLSEKDGSAHKKCKIFLCESHSNSNHPLTNKLHGGHSVDSTLIKSRTTIDPNNSNNFLNSKMNDFNILNVMVVLPNNVSKNGELLWPLKKDRSSPLSKGNLSCCETQTNHENVGLENIESRRLNIFNKGKNNDLLSTSSSSKETFNISYNELRNDLKSANNCSHINPVDLCANNSKLTINTHNTPRVLNEPLNSISNYSSNKKREPDKIQFYCSVNKSNKFNPNVQELCNYVEMKSSSDLENVSCEDSEEDSKENSETSFEKMSKQSGFPNFIKPLSPVNIHSHRLVTEHPSVMSHQQVIKNCILPSVAACSFENRCKMTNSSHGLLCERCSFNKNLLSCKHNTNHPSLYLHNCCSLNKESSSHQNNGFTSYENILPLSHEKLNFQKPKIFRPKLLPKLSPMSNLSLLVNYGSDIYLTPNNYKEVFKDNIEKIELSDSDVTAITVSDYSSDDEAYHVIHISSDSEEVDNECSEKEMSNKNLLENNIKLGNDIEKSLVSNFNNDIFQENLSEDEDESRVDLSRRRRRKTASNKRLESFVRNPVLPTLIKVNQPNEQELFAQHPKSVSVRQFKKLSNSLNLKSFRIVLEMLSPIVIEQTINLCRTKLNWSEREGLSAAGLTSYDINRLRLAVRQHNINNYSLRRFMKKNIFFQSGLSKAYKTSEKMKIRHMIKTQKKNLKAKQKKELHEKNLVSIRRALLKINCRYKNQSSFWFHLNKLCSS